MKFKKFLNTSYGSYLKVFLTTVLTLYLSEGLSIFHMDTESLKMLGSAGVASLIPIVINSLNSEDKRYGKKISKLTDLPPDKLD